MKKKTRERTTKMAMKEGKQEKIRANKVKQILSPRNKKSERGNGNRRGRGYSVRVSE
jgi:hypothetical protein